MKLEDHPTIARYRKAAALNQASPKQVLDAVELRQLVLEQGANDVGFVEIGRPELDDQRDDLLRFFPPAKSLIAFVCRMNRGPIQSPARSVANLEFHYAGDTVNVVARRVVAALESRGIWAANPAMGFPMEMDRFSGKIWTVSHKPIAEAAGLGRMGIHRNVIHPKFGNFILLGTVLVDAEISCYDQPLDFSPCLECKLCVAACPTGAIGADGHFDFLACYTHNYREFMGGFTDWVEQIADSSSAKQYRKRVNDQESASMWQSLSYGANYKAAYCMSVCPAGEDVIGPYLNDKKRYLDETVKPLTEKAETVYVVPRSDAEAHVARRFPQKTIRKIGNGLRPPSIRGFLAALPHLFQRHQSKGLNAVYHFTFTGDEPATATVTIRDKTIDVAEGLTGTADLHVTADARNWLGLLAKERSLVWSLIRRKIRLKGNPSLLVRFGKCFPS